ncbi:MAG: molybdopterin cofactor-binding domain-containing protein [Usitatibacter sp.]
MTDLQQLRPASPQAQPAAPLPKGIAAHPLVSQWIDFAKPGIAGLRTGRVELGQGNVTALVQMAADELELRMDQVAAVAGDTRVTPDEGFTSGSFSIDHGGQAVRLAASAARALFLARAASLLGAPASELSIKEGAVLRRGAATPHTYWTLRDSVDLRVEVARHAAPKPGERRLCGTSQARIDLPRKVAGSGFIHDLVLPGMRHGRVLHPPSRHARLLSADLASLEPKHGGITTVVNGSFVGVIALRPADAAEAIAEAARRCTWSAGAEAPADPVEAMWSSKSPSVVTFESGDVSAAAGRRFETAVSRPYLAHASIGPSCSVALWKGDRLSVWTHSQGVFPLRQALAMTLGIAADHIDVIHADGAGCYGHNGADDVALEAALLARAVPGSPVRVLWSRADELMHSPLGPAAVVKATATVGDDGMLAAMTLDITGQPYGQRPDRDGRANLLAAEYLEGAVALPPGGDIATGMERNSVPTYSIPSVRVTKRVASELPFRTSSLRSLGAYVNVFAIETLVDEIACELGKDPLAFRLAHLKDPRARVVLERLAAMCGWPGASKEGEGLGIAFARYKNAAAYCAVAACVDAGAKEVLVTHMWSVIDAGEVINPGGAVNQIEGGMVQSASWTLKECVHFEGEAIASRDWPGYPILKFSETPEASVEIIARPNDPPLGVAEAAQGPSAAAIANAVHAALGVRVRRLPITREAIVSAST